MVSTFGSLNTVVSGLMAQQLALNTTGHNIANSDTEGYSRQRVNLVASSSQQIYTNGGAAQLGTGVTTQSITRVRDSFIDRQYWRENSTLGTYSTVKTYLNKVEDVFNEPSATGLESLLNTFAESLKSLSTDASNHSTRAVAIQNGVSLCTTIQHEASQLMSIVSDINVTIGLRVDSINDITAEILSLNKQITSIEAGERDNANDLRDRRDYLTDQLSYMIDVHVTEDENGAYLIYGGGVSLVTATSRQELATKSRMDDDYNYEVIDIINARTGDVLSFKNGELAALITSRDSEESGVKKYLNDLSNIAKFLLQEFNDVHKAGIDLNGNEGGNFFGVAGQDYNNSSLNFMKGDWISHLKVNSELTDPSTGTYKLAARTLLGEAEQNNPKSGHAIIGGSSANFNIGNEIQVRIPDGSAGSQYTNVQYNSAGELVGDDSGGNTVTLVDADGNIKVLEYSVNGAAWTQCNALTTPETGSINFDINGLTIQIARSSYNTAGSTYTFKIPKDEQGTGAGDNLVNLYNRLKTDISSTIGNSSLDTYYSTQMGILGAQAKSADSMAENQQAVVNQLHELRESVSGIVQDEELTNMIIFQKGYNAASRLITAMDEMLDKLINGTGRVGL